jgi:hypothetical protein
MKFSCMRSAAFLALLMLTPGAWAQNSPALKIDPSGEHSRVYLSFSDTTTKNIIAWKFDFDIPRNQEYKPFTLMLTNASGKAIIALSIRWTWMSGDAIGCWNSFTDSLQLGGPGSGEGIWTRPPPAAHCWTTAEGAEVAHNGERMLVAPCMFIRESLGRPGGTSNLPGGLTRAETVSATLDAVVLQDGEVLGPDASGTVDSLRSRKTTIDVLLNAIKTGEQRGLDGVEVLKSLDSAPSLGRDKNIDYSLLRNLVRGLMLSKDWKQRLEKLSAIQVPNFHR